MAGKLPAHGDFVRRGGPVALLLDIDRWLDGELSGDDGNRDRIDLLHGWRFAFVADGRATIGVLVASEDAVGRRFPLVATLTLPGGDGVNPDGAAAWTDAAAAVLAEGRDAAWRADDVALALGAIPTPSTALSPAAAAGWWRGGGDRPILPDARFPSGSAFALLIEENGR